MRKEKRYITSKTKFQFSNVVVVEKNLIGVIVETWETKRGKFEYDVYVRSFDGIFTYKEDQIKHFVYSKELFKDELSFYN